MLQGAVVKDQSLVIQVSVLRSVGTQRVLQPMGPATAHALEQTLAPPMWCGFTDMHSANIVSQRGFHPGLRRPRRWQCAPDRAVMQL